MQLARLPFALDRARMSPGRAALVDPRHFGRGPRRVLAAARVERAISDDVKLFATTFAAGFLFVSLLIA